MSTQRTFAMIAVLCSSLSFSSASFAQHGGHFGGHPGWGNGGHPGWGNGGHPGWGNGGHPGWGNGGHPGWGGWGSAGRFWGGAFHYPRYWYGGNWGGYNYNPGYYYTDYYPDGRLYPYTSVYTGSSPVCQCTYSQGYCMIYRPGEPTALRSYQSNSCSVQDCQSWFGDIITQQCGNSWGFQ